MEKNEYKDNEKVLYRTKGKLCLPQTEPEEVYVIVTRGHVGIGAEEITKGE